jgi:excisionase family DNA binding protein
MDWTDKLMVKPADAGEILSVGRSKVYELIAAGKLPSVRVGGSVRVPVAALKEWLDRKLNGQSANNEPSDDV